MKSAVIFVLLTIAALACSGCATQPALGPSDTLANTSANYDYKGDITRDGGTDCWYYCP